MHPLNDLIVTNITIDIKQMIEEGHDEASLLSELQSVEQRGTVDALLAFQEELWNRPSPASFPYLEPNDWATISAGFPDPESHARFRGSEADLRDRLHAAWLGRCAGCMLGQPVEGVHWPDRLRKLLEFVGSWPLIDYVNRTGADVDPAKSQDPVWVDNLKWKPATRGRLQAVRPDDDIHYALISLRVLEKFGVKFTSEQAMSQVIVYTPGGSIWAAGRNMWRTGSFGFKPPHTALFGNPCRQSLGAMIRCDPWGWASPGNPALAARLAYEDAVGSQTRNGIYSGIFFSVLLADTLATGDPVRSIDTAAAYVPPRSRFAEMVRFVRQQCAGEPDWEKVNAAIYARYPAECKQFNHSLPNAAIVLLGLLKGGGDFTRTLGITVSAAMDTDCTGATAGSIMGCALGTRAIPEHWTQPFNNTIHTDLAEMRELRISEVAERTFEVARKNVRYAN
ncbi:MAG: hypothetical protein C0404_08260 [Verrucomicrobia bacterium]|nr:hypothetical protein [Verrucomicrobiota bacterium]